jgi:catechol 2,3-dioxygenase-like lactoylglutathione lyase family enzyme
MTVKHLDHLNLTVNSFEESAAWYRRVLGFEVVEQGLYNNRPWGVIKAGDAMLCIYEDPGRTHAGGDELRERRLHGLNHFALRITDTAAWRETLKRENIPTVHGEEWHWPHSTSWYIQDPTGYQIEVAAWHRDEARFQQA